MDTRAGRGEPVYYLSRSGKQDVQHLGEIPRAINLVAMRHGIQHLRRCEHLSASFKTGRTRGRKRDTNPLETLYSLALCFGKVRRPSVDILALLINMSC
jgi:hypothetical protein